MQGPDRIRSEEASVADRHALYELLEPYEARIVSGHLHQNDHSHEGAVREHVVGTVCGAWWSGPICPDGTPNGYALYEARGETFTWRYMSIGYDPRYQIRTYAHGADPKAPDDIVANIWDWDEGWTVVWYEDGMARGAMLRRDARDPLSVALYGGGDRPRGKGWVTPSSNGHMFYAPASHGARDIVVEATDRFGRTYSSRVERGGDVFPPRRRDVW